jgi:hypothetical protein
VPGIDLVLFLLELELALWALGKPSDQDECSAADDIHRFVRILNAVLLVARTGGCE